jgi:hypothetical protein
MPKPRAKISAEEAAIIDKGGAPGTVTPLPVDQPAKPEEKQAEQKKGIYRPTMIRFTPAEYDQVEDAYKRISEKQDARRLSMNAFLISAVFRGIKAMERGE